MQSTENDEKATAAKKLEHWLRFAEANRPGHDSLRGVSYEPAPIRQAWLADVLTALAAERDRADRAEARLVNAPHDGPRDGDDGYGCHAGLIADAKGTCWKAEL